MSNRLLSKKQKEVLEFITSFWKKEGRIPTVREVTKALGLNSSGSGYFHMKALVEKGYLSQDKNGRFYLKNLINEEVIYLPLIGTIRAGIPVESPEYIEEYIPVPKNFVKIPEKSFLLKVRGDSMEGAHILDGDLIIVQKQDTAQKGEIVVALKDGESTVKFLSENYGIPCLKPANPRYSEIYPPFKIIGKVVGVIRLFK
ncbi:transcriptional repressor LexA [Dictyoglomus thermophilum]|uniref:LexA repressor n=2 Tax=Dictyoglomus thermophilum TaxID=14 RepID=B5YB12_DICT6|nr:transcriptional repressor LexA [Dictyoglomus thermophilum]ACI18266.1 LexA repressor [Dictyoglomus thermophilum H-6-12]MCX7720594.1 transcriptional repressor LexA [Dictyoglomus thermophilum]TYT24258.1 repressor LexA [Dictyoglomus thermophilum]